VQEEEDTCQRRALNAVVDIIVFAGGAAYIQLRQALALFWVPQDDFDVIPAARKNLAVGRGRR
jgi:hypothetical protein